MIRVNDRIIKEVATELAGPDTVELALFLKKTKVKISEFKIAEDLKKDIKDVRNQLYRLFRINLVSYTRKKDRQKGWYIYSWIFNPPRVKDLYVRLKQDRMEMLNQRLERENSNQFFLCRSACARIDFESATEFEFECPECGDLLQQLDNTKTISNLHEQIEILQKQMKKEGIKSSSSSS